MLHRPCAIAHGVLNWDDLRFFLAIVRARTLAGAARELKVEHTTVGRRLKALETALGTHLFTHGPDGYTLTQAGEAILPAAEEIETRARTVARLVSGDDARIEGTVRFTTSESFSGYFAAQLAELHRRHPALMVEILSDNRAYDLMRGEADLAFRVRLDSPPDLIGRKVASFGWTLYAAPAYLERHGQPDCWDLAGRDVIGYDDSLAQVPGALWLAEHAPKARIVLRANSIVTAKNATLAGMGIGLLPCFIVADEPGLVRLMPETVGERDAFLVVHPDLVNVARVRAVMDFVTEVVKRDALRWNAPPQG